MTHFLPNRLGALLLIFTGLFIGGCSKPDYTDSTGQQGKFSDYQGQWLIINYWATWCKPCIKEIPELNKLAEENEDKLTVFGVDFDLSTDQDLAQKIAKLNVGFPILIEEPNEILGYPRPTILPTTLVFNPQGQLHKTLIGPQTAQSIMQATSL